MSDQMVAAFLQGLGIVAVAAFCYEAALRHCPSDAWRKVAAGVVFALGALASMSFPVELTPGLIFDLRHVFLVLSAAYGGLPATLLCAAAAALYRIQIGGVGLAAGLTGIAMSAMIGLALARVVAGRVNAVRSLVLLGLGASVSAGSLFVLPWDFAVATLAAVAPGFVLANLVGTVVAGKALGGQLSRRQHELVLSEYASTDALTGLFNRRAFEAHAAEIVARTASSGGMCALFLADVDHFKRINDVFGHPAGDAVLQAVASKLKESAGELALVSRFGGEEFAILWPCLSPAQVPDKAEAIRRAVERTTHELKGIPVTVTVSLGVQRVTGRNLAQAFAEADEALYRAKAGGRNRTELAAAA